MFTEGAKHYRASHTDSWKADLASLRTEGNLTGDFDGNDLEMSRVRSQDVE